SDNDIDTFTITDAYRSFTDDLRGQRASRPSALRDILSLPIDLAAATGVDLAVALDRMFTRSTSSAVVRGLS
ncbi:hypothetical protein G3I15_56625, partial [Streptomyces sp. SID10244]|nr:hypothetical protein [Streptomyces sp. SID10244]